MNADDYLVVLCTCPADSAATLADALIENRLAACINRVENVISKYRWQGKIIEDHECLLVIKTRTDRFPLLRDLIQTLHPYSVPEILAFLPADGLQEYFSWIDECLDKPDA